MESYKKLFERQEEGVLSRILQSEVRRARRMNLMHMGLVVIGLKGLTRKNLGTKVLITLYDSRWSETRQNTTSMERIYFGKQNLGILNYARSFIKDLGKVAGPLY